MVGELQGNEDRRFERGALISAPCERLPGSGRDDALPRGPLRQMVAEIGYRDLLQR